MKWDHPWMMVVIVTLTFEPHQSYHCVAVQHQQWFITSTDSFWEHPSTSNKSVSTVHTIHRTYLLHNTPLKWLGLGIQTSWIGLGKDCKGKCCLLCETKLDSSL